MSAAASKTLQRLEGQVGEVVGRVTELTEQCVRLEDAAKETQSQRKLLTELQDGLSSALQAIEEISQQAVSFSQDQKKAHPQAVQAEKNARELETLGRRVDETERSTG
eukprot:RCo004433